MKNAAKCRNVHISQKEGESRRGPDGFAQDWRQRRRKPLRSENKQMHIRSDRKEKKRESGSLSLVNVVDNVSS